MRLAGRRLARLGPTLRLTQGRQLLLQRHIRGLHGIEPPLQHACLVTRVTKLRLQG